MWLAMLALSGMSASPEFTEQKPEPPGYVRFTVEIRGTMRVEKGRAQVAVFVNGSCLIIIYEVWDLDFGNDDELRKAAEQLNGKKVVVTGEPPRSYGRLESSLSAPALGFDGKPIVYVPPPPVVRVKSVKIAEGK